MRLALALIALSVSWLALARPAAAHAPVWTITPPAHWVADHDQDDEVEYRPAAGPAKLHLATQLWEVASTRAQLDTMLDTLVRTYVAGDRLISTRRHDSGTGVTLDLVLATQHVIAIAMPEATEIRLTVAACSGAPTIPAECEAALATFGIAPALTQYPVSESTVEPEHNPFLSLLKVVCAGALVLLVIYAWARREQRRIRERPNVSGVPEVDDDDADVL